MHVFLADHRAELIARCKAKVALRPHRAATEAQLANGVPLFLAQLTKTLQAEEAGALEESRRISGPSGGDAVDLSEIGVTASSHGKEMLGLGYSVDQVVHDYGDLCQSITDLAFERDAPFTIDEFRTLNRCLDNPMADAVTAFSGQRDADIASKHSAEAYERIGILVHELRNHVHTATMAFAALQSGKITIGGATANVLKRSLRSITTLLTAALAEVRTGVASNGHATFAVGPFIAEASAAASLDAQRRGCPFAMPVVDPSLSVTGDREILLDALANLLQNGFKFTRPHTEVTLSAEAVDDRILIDVADHCGGLPHGAAERMFGRFDQRSEDRSGLGLGLSIARDGVEASNGALGVRDLPGDGCVFTISLPRA